MTTRRIDFAGREWSAFAQDSWTDHAGNPAFPDYLRITFVAYGRHAANGHARLGTGELAQYLIRRDGTVPDRRSLRHSIDRAVEFGFLLPQSRVLCLVVSSAHVQGGVGDPDRPCPRDHTIRHKDVVPQRPSRQKDAVGAGRFTRKDVVPQRPFVLASSLSSSHHEFSRGASAS